MVYLERVERKNFATLGEVLCNNEQPRNLIGHNLAQEIQLCSDHFLPGEECGQDTRLRCQLTTWPHNHTYSNFKNSYKRNHRHMSSTCLAHVHLNYQYKEKGQHGFKLHWASHDQYHDIKIMTNCLTRTTQTLSTQILEFKMVTHTFKNIHRDTCCIEIFRLVEVMLQSSKLSCVPNWIMTSAMFDVSLAII